MMALTATLLVSALLVAGCGCGKSSKPATGAQAILDQSQKATADVKSVKAAGTANVITPDSEVKEARTTFEMQGNFISETEVQARIVATDEKGQTTEAYIMDGYAYSYSTLTGWEKQKVDEAQGLSSGMISPGQVTELSKYAENLEELPEEDGSYVISFDVGSKFFEETLTGAQDQAAEPTTEEQQAAQDMMELAKQMLDGLEMTVVMKIDKETYFPTSIVLEMSLKDAPMLGDMSVEMEVSFSEYNTPVAVVLPEEAKSAPERPSGLPGGLPGIPGLGL